MLYRFLFCSQLVKDACEFWLRFYCELKIMYNTICLLFFTTDLTVLFCQITQIRLKFNNLTDKIFYLIKNGINVFINYLNIKFCLLVRHNLWEVLKIQIILLKFFLAPCLFIKEIQNYFFLVNIYFTISIVYRFNIYTFLCMSY